MSKKELKLAEVAENLASWAKSEYKMLIISHRSPDGDTLGSAFALKLMYEAMGGCAYCTCQSEAAPFLRFLYSGQDEIEYTEGSECDYDKIISVDVASLSTLGELAHLADKIDMMIDHHEIGERFADYFVDGKRSAAGEIVFDIYEYLIEKGYITTIPEAAKRMYAAISSDSGSFKFSNTSERTHIIAGRLVSEMSAAGIEHAEVGRILHDSFSFDDLRARKLAIDNLKVICDGKLAYVMITNKTLEESGLTEDNTGSIVDIPRSLEGVLVAVAIKQKGENEYRIQSRSNSGIDVAAICSTLGGGGHRKAAGARYICDSAEEAEKYITDIFAKAVYEYSEENN